MSKPSWLQHIGKSLAVLASTGAALVSIITALFSYGFLGNAESHQSIGNFGAAWVRLNPVVDTAYAIGDTIRFAATIADKNGSILVGASPTWTTGDSTVATVEEGAVVARGAGATTISVIVGKLVSQAHIMVKPRVAGVILSTSLGDTALTLGEDKTLALRARGVDARGHGVSRTVPASWHVDDTTVATLDAQGVLTARNPGRTVVSATMDGISGYLPVTIVSVASALDVVAGANQRAIAGKQLAQPVVVRATTRRGGPAIGKVVRFRTAATVIGSVQPDSVITDADGRARAIWTLGSPPGRQTLLATVENVDSAVSIGAEADPDAANTRVIPIVEQLHARAGEMLTDSVGVRVTDSVGRALPDVPVRWVALQGSAEAVTARTDSLGVAKVRWTLAKEMGVQKLRAYVGGASGSLGIPPVSIMSTAAAGIAADIAIIDGDNQRGIVGAPLRKPVRLRVLDGNGNGVAATQVVLSLSGGSVPDTLTSTDSTGVVRVEWTMGRSAGEYSLAAHVDGVKKLLKLSARAAPAPAANLSFDDAPEKNARPQVKRLVAVVTDEYGNPVPDAAVTFSVPKGMVTPARAITDVKGRVEVRWMVSGTGEQTLRGSVRGTDVRAQYVMSAPTARPAATRPKTTTKKRG